MFIPFWGLLAVFVTLYLLARRIEEIEDDLDERSAGDDEPNDWDD
jgi:hypothetical protein